MTSRAPRVALLIPMVALALAACTAVAAAASLGNVTVNYDPYPTWKITPSSLTGVAGDTFTLTNERYNDAGLSYVSLVNDTGQVTLGGTPCTADGSCPVYDKLTNPKNAGTFTVVTPGTLTVRRYLNNPQATSTIGTLTIAASAPAPAPAAPAITVTGVSPASGLSTGGEVIDITGSGFSGGSRPTVTLGGTAATDVTVVSDTRITATTPARAAGAVDVTVSRDGGTGTKAGAYTYNQGYWLRVTNSQPPGTGASTERSTGAVRTSALGDWANEEATNSGLFFTTTTYRAYRGGINCGNRVVRSTVIGGYNWFGSEKKWFSGPCRFALPAGTKVALSAFPSSSTSDIPLFFDDYWTGLFNRWTGACTATTSECTVTMNADRSARATWGRFTWGLISGVATATPVFADDGSLSYSLLTVGFTAKENAVTGKPDFTMVSTVTTGASATARDTAARAVTACRGHARRVGGRLEARCTPTPALAAALRKGKVRLTTKWYLRAPRQKATYPLGQARAHLSNRRAGAVTG